MIEYCRLYDVTRLPLSMGGDQRTFSEFFVFEMTTGGRGAKGFVARVTNFTDSENDPRMSA